MRRPGERVAALALLGALGAGCAASATAPGEPAGDRPPSGFPVPTGTCIFLDTIEDWKAVDPYHLLVRTRATGWQWAITLDRRCSDILFANALAWDTPDSRVCDYRADAITVPGDRCSIGSIQPYEDPPEATPTPEVGDGAKGG
jgi:hypothetical protein